MNNKKQTLILSIVIIFVFSLLIVVYSFKDNNKTIIMNEKKINNNKAISIMLETGIETGVYELSESTSFPSSGYILNTTKSGCENGSTLSYDKVTKEVIIKGNISDKCYIFLDVEPPDLYVSLNNFPETYGKSVTVTPTGVTAVYNNKLNQLELSNLTTNKMRVSLTYSNPTGTTPLNTYLLGLSGTTQGDGQFVNETVEIPDYTTSTVAKSYGTTPVYFRNTSSNSTAQTQVDSFWTFNSSTGVFTSEPSKFTTSGTGNYYHAYMKVPSAGYYQICYTIAQAPSTNNQLYIVKSASNIIASIGSSTGAQISETCLDIGYFESTDYFNISERGYSGTSSPVMTFRIEKANNIIPIDTGHRYEGSNPNNYAMFNNELWRIIGVFSTEYDTNNDGMVDTTSNLVKIIREDTIGALAWDKSNTNDWPNSSLYHLLNEQYYDWETNKTNVSTYCYGYSTSAPSKCDYSIKGIQDGYRNMLVKAKWYLGGGGKSGYTTYTPDNVYSYERDANAIYSGRSASTPGYIGLMYESDYLYGVLASDCARTTAHGSYNSASCAGKDWLYGKGYEWTISPNSSDLNDPWRLNNVGSVGSFRALHGHGVRPVLYLSPSVYKVSGTGTITDPYIMGM